MIDHANPNRNREQGGSLYRTMPPPHPPYKGYARVEQSPTKPRQTKWIRYKKPIAKPSETKPKPSPNQSCMEAKRIGVTMDLSHPRPQSIKQKPPEQRLAKPSETKPKPSF